MLGIGRLPEEGATLKRERRNFLFALAGARQEILEQCPTERVKFQSLGTAILITSVMATVSMWFALNSVLGVNAFVALLGAIVWGLVIMGIDRWLVSSMPPTGGRRWSIAVPRLVLAILLGTLISTPIVLRIFQSEINAQIVIIKQDRASNFIALQQKSKVGDQVDYWTKDVSNLEKVITSNGSVTINPATDPIVKALIKQRAQEITLEHTYYEQWQCQLYGGAGCTKKGNGPLAQASEASYHQAATQVSKLTNAIQKRDGQLNAGNAHARSIRVQEATAALPAAKQHLAAVTAQEDALEAKYAAQNLNTNGLLIRLEALNQLSGKSFTVNAARLLLFLLFLVIECLPVTVKLMLPPGNYERILQAEIEHEYREARRNYGRVRTADPVGAPPGNKAAPPARGANGPARSQALTAELSEIWRPTRMMPTSDRMTVAEPAPEPASAPVEESSHVVNDRLRGMAELPAGSDPDRRNGGIDLHYRDDDL
jgi:hypothetical protein